MQLILASQSPRRKALLEQINIPFQVQIADVDETMDPQADPYDEVARLSRAKAAAIAAEGDQVVVAADTVVVCDGQVLGKPESPQQAAAMLTMLSGRSHQVMTGLTVARGQRVLSCTQVTDIWFRDLSQREIAAYVASGDPMDKAGAYGIQSGAARFVCHMVGDYYNVVGLPVCRLWQLLQEIAPELTEDMP